MKLGNLMGLAKAIFAGGGGSSKSMVGDLEVDAIIERTTNLDSEVTDYPVEDGFPVADHVTRQPLTLSMTCVCTPTPLDGSAGLFATAGAMLRGQRSSSNTLQGTADKLLAIYQAGEPITITTPDAIYDNMVMTRAPLPRNVEDGICYKLSLEFKHVRIVVQETAEVDSEAEGSAGKSEVSAGAASQKEIGTGMTTVNNQPFIAMDSTAVGLAVAGTITTGALSTAAMAAYSSYQSFNPNAVPTVGGGFGGGLGL